MIKSMIFLGFLVDGVKKPMDIRGEARGAKRSALRTQIRAFFSGEGVK